MSFSYKQVSGSLVAKAYLTSILGIISGLFTQLVFIKGLARTVTAEEFTLYAFIFQIVSYLAIFQLGLDFTTSREISLNLGKNDPAMANYAYWFIKRFNKKIVWLVILVTLLGAVYFYLGYGLQARYDPGVAAELLLLFGAWQVVVFLILPKVAALIGSNQQHIANINNVVVNIISTLGAWVLLQFGFGLYALPLSLLLFAIANNIFIQHLVRRYCAWRTERPSERDIDREKKTIRFSVVTSLGGLAWTIEATSDVIILNAMGLMHLVGLYVIWWRFPQMFFDLATRLTTSSIPALTSAYGRSEKESFQLFEKLLLVVSGFGMLIFVGLVLWLPSFVQIWVGYKYYYPNYKVFGFLVGFLVFTRIIGNCFGMYIIALGKVKVTTTLLWVQAVFIVLLAVLLTRFFKLEGLLFASVIASFIQVFGVGKYLFQMKAIPPRMVFLLTMIVVTSALVLYYTPIIETQWDSFLLKVLITAVTSLLLYVLYIWALGYNKTIALKNLKL